MGWPYWELARSRHAAEAADPAGIPTRGGAVLGVGAAPARRRGGRSGRNPGSRGGRIGSWRGAGTPPRRPIRPESRLAGWLYWELARPRHAAEAADPAGIPARGVAVLGVGAEPARRRGGRSGRNPDSRGGRIGSWRGAGTPPRRPIRPESRL